MLLYIAYRKIFVVKVNFEYHLSTYFSRITLLTSISHHSNIHHTNEVTNIKIGSQCLRYMRTEFTHRHPDAR
jgi:hypothetical protein